MPGGVGSLNQYQYLILQNRYGIPQSNGAVLGRCELNFKKTSWIYEILSDVKTGCKWPSEESYVEDMDQISIKTANPKCRVYWCLIEFIDLRLRQTCWYFRPLL
jgi:hypothetical protein